MYLIWTRTPDLPACSTVPQPTTLLGAPTASEPNHIYFRHVTCEFHATFPRVNPHSFQGWLILGLRNDTVYRLQRRKRSKDNSEWRISNCLSPGNIMDVIRKDRQSPRRSQDRREVHAAQQVNTGSPINAWSQNPVLRKVLKRDGIFSAE
jgi:hypothetical protein